MKASHVLAHLLFGCTATFLLLPGAGAAQSDAQDGVKLAGRAMAVLNRHCSKCHGDSGAPDLNLLNLNRRADMLAKRQLVPREPDSSRIYIRMALTPGDPMPPRSTKDTLTEAEKKSVKDWIAIGAAPVADMRPAGPPAAKFITGAEILKAIASDLAAVPEADRPFMRYFVLTHLANSGASEADLTLYRAACSRLINSLSWTRIVAVPRTVDRAGTLQRIDLRQYAWTPATWQRLLVGYPYAVTSTSQTAQAIYQHTRCDLPYIRTDWFIANAALPPRYHDLLGLPATVQQLEVLLHVDSSEDLRLKTVRRSGFSESGISRNNRVVERHDTDFGAYWRSFDFAANSGKQNIFENPLTFAEAGGEIIFSLPNGLQAYMLVNGAGRRIDTAPIDIVSNKEDPHDPVVRNGLTCMSCHAQGIKRFDDRADQLRQVILAGREQRTANFSKAALALYSEKAEIVGLLNDDAARFEHAVSATGSDTQHGDPVVLLAKRFGQSLNVSQAAGEVGITEPVFQERLNASPRLGALRALLAAAGGVIKRDAWEEYFSAAVQEAAPDSGSRVVQHAMPDPPELRLNGSDYVVVGQPEIMIASFKSEHGVSTVESYSGLVLVSVTGVGQAESHYHNDAFYLYDAGDGKPPRADPYFDQLIFGTAPFEPSPANNAKRKLVGVLPPYNPAHSYTFVLDTSLQAPGRLFFGVGDRGFEDNTGAFTIQIVQLRPAR